MCCKAPGATETREIATGKFEDNLINAGTHPGITPILLLAIRGAPAPAVKNLGPGDANLTTAISEQTEIGWGIVKYGFLSQAWAISHTWYADRRGLELVCAKEHCWTAMLHKPVGVR